MAAGWVTAALAVGGVGCASGGATSVPSAGPPRTPCRAPSPPAALRAGPAARTGLLVGLSAAVRNWQGNQACNLLAATRASGAAALREDLDWTVVAPRRGARNWGPFDRVIGRAADFGMIVLPLLDGRPRWLRGPHDLEIAYAAFVASAVARYGPGGAFWRGHPRLAAAAPVWFELDNEPYLPSPDRLSASDYANLVVAAVKAGRRANPAARYLAAAEAAYPRIGDGSGDWVDDMFAARPDLGRYADAFAVHPYSPAPPAAYDPVDPSLQVGRIEAIHDRLVANVGGPVSLWITELGWSTCSQRPPCVTTPQQARDITTAFALARTRWAPYVRALFIFGFSQPSADPTPPAQPDGYGIVDADLRPKPGLAAFRIAAGGG